MLFTIQITFYNTKKPEKKTPGLSSVFWFELKFMFIVYFDMPVYFLHLFKYSIADKTYYILYHTITLYDRKTFQTCDN